MTMVDADWSIDRATRNIRYIGDGHGGGSPSYATVIEFHRWLQDKADDQSSAGDDELDITDTNPSDRSTNNIIALVNGYNITQTEAEHLYDGSISQAGGDDIWVGLVVVGDVPDGTVLQIVKNNTFEDDAVAPYWGATSSGVALNGDLSKNILLRVCVQVRAGGSDIDGQRLRVQARELGDTFAEFRLTANLGNNTAAIFTSTDLNNQTAEGTIAALSITNGNEGYIGLDVDGDTNNEFYYSQWNLNGDSINDLYEYTKWLQSRDGSQVAAQTDVYGLNGMLFRGITHEIDIDTNTGTFQEPEQVSWANGTGQLLAIDSTTAGTKMWIQLLTGVAPVDNEVITGDTSGATCQVNVTVNSRTAPSSFVGNSTGVALIGAYGLGVNPSDLSASDQLFDLTNTLVTPPNNVQFVVNGLVVGEDRVLVAPWDGSTLDALGNPVPDVTQMALQNTLSGAAVTSIQVSAAIPLDTPTAGVIRVVTDSGLEKYVEYTSYTGDTFTVNSSDFSTDNATAGNGVWVGYIDKLATATTESFTSIFQSNRNLLVRVRDGGATPIKEFITSAVLGAAGGSTTAIRTSDL